MLTVAEGEAVAVRAEPDHRDAEDRGDAALGEHPLEDDLGLAGVRRHHHLAAPDQREVDAPEGGRSPFSGHTAAKVGQG